MFWALKGATSKPRSLKMRHRAVTRTLLPTEDAVPCTISTLPGIQHLPEGFEQDVVFARRTHRETDMGRQAERGAVAHGHAQAQERDSDPARVADFDEHEVGRPLVHA